MSGGNNYNACLITFLLVTILGGNEVFKGNLCCSGEDKFVSENKNGLGKVLNCGLQPDEDSVIEKGVISVNQFPWLVGILRDGIIKCTGTLISARYILTGAECLLKNHLLQTGFEARIEEYSVNKPRCDRNPWFSRLFCIQYRDYPIEETIIHPEYDAAIGTNDVALSRLKILVSSKGYTRPICLPTSVDKHREIGDVLFIVGWKRRPLGVYPARLSRWSEQVKTLTKFIDNEECRQMQNVTESALDYNFCTRSVNVTEDDCEFEITGNPVMYFDGTRWYLEGISNSCNKTPTPMMNTKIGNYLQWIEQNIKNESCTTPDGEHGELRRLRDCPKLLNALANPTKDTEMYLREFIFPRNISYSWDYDSFLVCCSIYSNFTVSNTNSSSPSIVEVSKKVPISRYCGLQHRDDYFSENKNISTDEFPWLVGVYSIYDDNDTSLECLGALIYDKFVLTATTLIKHIERKLFVRLGGYHIKNKTNCIDLPELDVTDCSEVADYYVEKIHFHPFANIDRTGLYNIALLQLHTSVTFSDYIRPICLPKQGFDLPKVGDTLYSSGWGKANWTHLSDTIIKKKVATTLVSKEKCMERFRISAYDIIPPFHFCTEDFKNGSEVLCSGDEGAPIMVSYKHKWYLVGLSLETYCEDPIPKIHTRVSKYLEWIYKTIQA